MNTSIPPEKTKTTPASAAKKPTVAKRTALAAPPKAKPARKTVGVKKSAIGASKTAKILELLKRPSGVTLKEIMKATHWQAHSVRGFLSGAVKKKMGIAVESFNKNDGERGYRILSK